MGITLNLGNIHHIIVEPPREVSDCVVEVHGSDHLCPGCDGTACKKLIEGQVLLYGHGDLDSEMSVITFSSTKGAFGGGKFKIEVRNSNGSTNFVQEI